LLAAEGGALRQLRCTVELNADANAVKLQPGAPRLAGRKSRMSSLIMTLRCRIAFFAADGFGMETRKVSGRCELTFRS
jgi:hypothetical protein